MKTKAKRLLAVFLAVTMIFSVFTVEAFAALKIDIVEVFYQNNGDEPPLVRAKVTGDHGVPTFEVFLTKEAKAGEPEGKFGDAMINGKKYHLTHIGTPKYETNTDGTVTYEPVGGMYPGDDGTSPKAGDKIGVVIEDTATGEYSNVVDVTVPKSGDSVTVKPGGGGGGETPEPEEEKWVKKYNEKTHWDECVSGASAGKKKNEQIHTLKKQVLKVSYPSGFDKEDSLSAENSPVLTDSKGNTYTYDGEYGFKPTKDESEPGKKIVFDTAPYWNDSEWMMQGVNIGLNSCTVCGFGDTCTFSSEEVLVPGVDTDSNVDAVDIFNYSIGGETKNGALVYFDKAKATKGETVTVAIMTALDVELKEVTATCKGKEVELISADNDLASFPGIDLEAIADDSSSFVLYSFSQPAGGVSVKVKTSKDSGSSDIPATGLKLSKNTATVYVSGTASLSAIITPSNATNKDVLWKSDNESVAKVSGSGISATVTGVSEGTAVITATLMTTTADGTSTYLLEDTCTVTVKKYEGGGGGGHSGGGGGYSGGGGGSTTPTDTTPTATTPTPTITATSGSGEFDDEKGIYLEWNAAEGVSKYGVGVKFDGKFRNLADVGTATSCWVKHGSTDVFYVATTGDYTAYKYDKASGKFSRTGTVLAGNIGKIPAKNDVTDEFIVRYTLAGKESADKNSCTFSKLVYYKPAVKATVKSGVITLGYKAVPNATEYQLCKVVDGKLKPIATTTKLGFKFKTKKAGKTFTFAVRAKDENGEWTKVYTSDHVIVTSK